MANVPAFWVLFSEGREQSLKEAYEGDFWLPWKLAKTALKKSDGESSGGSSLIHTSARTHTPFCSFNSPF